MAKMNYAEIYKDEITNGLGIGVSIFVSGCDLNPHCHGCFNSVAWDYSAGKPFTEEVKDEFLDLADKPYIERISILGGEPMAEQNYETVYNLIQSIRDRFGSDRRIWLYSGYTFEQLMDKPQNKILPLIDILVDGRFVEAQKDLSLPFRGSKNQRIIQIQPTLKQEKITLLNI